MNFPEFSEFFIKNLIPRFPVEWSFCEAPINIITRYRRSFARPLTVLDHEHGLLVASVLIGQVFGDQHLLDDVVLQFVNTGHQVALILCGVHRL